MTSKIHTAMADIMSQVDGLTKDNTSQGGFKYRGIDDVYNLLHDILAANRVVTIPRVKEVHREERLSSAGKTLIYTLLHVEYDFVADDGSLITAGPVVGEAFDTGDKSAMKAMAIAHKYVMLQTFLVPTNLSVDPDAEVHTISNAEVGNPKPAQAIPMATPGQWKTLNDYRELGATTGEMNDYLDNKSTSLTAKQAGQLINKIEEGIGAEEKK
jgi:hypothetical protein